VNKRQLFDLIHFNPGHVVSFHQNWKFLFVFLCVKAIFGAPKSAPAY
jgi:hypothetical protein